MAEPAVQEIGGHSLLNLHVIAILAASYTSVMGVQMVSPLLPGMRASLRLSAVEAGCIVSGFSISALIMTLPAVIIADRIGSRRVLSASLLIFGVSGSGISVFHSLGAVMILRVIQGIGYSAVLPLTIATLTLEVPREKVAMAQSYRAVTMSTAEFTLPLFAGAVLALSGEWQFTFAVLIVPALLGVAVLRQAPTPRPAGPRRSDP
jgi:MFS family permease